MNQNSDSQQSAQGNTNQENANSVNQSGNTNIAQQNTNTANTPAVGGEDLSLFVAEDTTWQIENTDKQSKTTTQDNITTVEFADGTVTVMPEENEGIVMHSFGSTKVEDIKVGSVPAQKITGSSAKDGSEVVYILLKHEGLLYEFQGKDAFLNDTVPNTFTFLK